MILFDEAAHRYYDTKGDLISATTLIKQYAHPFDADYHAQNRAAQTGKPAEQIKREWKDYGEFRANFGTEFHAVKEAQDTNGVARFGERIVPSHNQWLLLQRANKWNYTEQLLDGFYAELRLWHDGYRVCGTADKTFIETVNGRRFMHIEDHKTNKKLPRESYQFRNGRYKMMLPPVQHIMDCAFWHYNLQLSLYMFMAEYLGFAVGEMRILHYPVTDFEILQGIEPTLEELLQRKPEVYPVKYLKKEVLSICNDYLRRTRAA